MSFQLLALKTVDLLYIVGNNNNKNGTNPRQFPEVAVNSGEWTEFHLKTFEGFAFQSKMKVDFFGN